MLFLGRGGENKIGKRGKMRNERERMGNIIIRGKEVTQ